jgi:thermitase
MNSWLRCFITLCVVLCLLSLGTLGWLAFVTTESRPEAGVAEFSDPSPVLPPQESSDGRAQGPAAPDEEPEVQTGHEDLLAKLAALNASKAVVPGELLLTFRSPEALAAFRLRAREAGIQVLYSDSRLNAARVRYQDAARLAEELVEHGADYKNIGPNALIWVPGTPEPPPKDAANAGGLAAFESSGLQMLGVEAVDRARWGQGVKVAVLDTGVTDHPSLQNVKVTHFDLVKDGQAYNGHGTAMASLIAGQNGQEGGVAPASEILDIRVADGEGLGNVGFVAQGILQAVDAGARVINISLGTPTDTSLLRGAVDYATSRGVIVVAAAGNEQVSQLAYPAGYAGVISVAAVDAQGRQAYFSNSGEGLFIAAPGVGIVSAYSEGKTVIGSGTSQAAALTSGAVSALLSRHYQAARVPQVLTQNAYRTGAPASQVGAGILRLP